MATPTFIDPMAAPDMRELFRALEFAHYAERFRGSTFVMALPAGVPFSELLLDFKVLDSYHIRVALVTRDPDFQLETVISQANKRGARFQLSLLTELLLDAPSSAPELDFERMAQFLEQGRTPVIAYHGDTAEAEESGAPARPADALDPSYALGAQVALRLGARKLILATPLAKALRAALPRSSVQPDDLEGLPKRLWEMGLPEAQPLCGYVAGLLAEGIPDVVLLEGRSGHLFREVFTYDGAGILFTATRAARIRHAEMRDVTDIGLLLRPEIDSGAILPVPEVRIEGNIANYWVYEIDNMPVGVACLKRFGDDAELAQFSTLPRYRGRGRARELAQFLVERAREQGYRGVFALSIDPRMWEFFQALGFQAVERETLPEPWRQDYDLQRPSRAFRKEL